MSKLPASEPPAPDLVTVRATCTIKDGSALRSPGSVFEVPWKDAELLLKAGAVTLSTDVPPVAIEEVLPIGMDPAIWMADPRLKVNGSPPSCFVKISDFAALIDKR
jgi:hypothetical protein